MRAAASLACQRALPCTERWAQIRRAPRTQRRRPAAPRTPPPPAAAAGGSQQQPPSASTAPDPRQQHLAFQADYFDRTVPALQAAITPAVDANLARVAASIPGLSAESRVLDAGAGEGALIPHLQVRDRNGAA